MKAPDTIQVFEYETLRVGQNGFSPHHLDRLARYKEERQCPFYNLGYNAIHFSNYVGVLQVHDLVIEVLPKTGRVSDKELWRNVLIDMLKVSGFLNIKSLSEASLQLRGGSLLELFFEVYLSYCRTILTEGIVRRYQLDTMNRKALKGRLLFSDNMKHNLIRKERFYTESQEYSVDNIYNRILYKALSILAKTSNSSAQRKDASLMIQQNDGVSDLHCTQDTFDRLKYDRTTERYKSAMQLAELIIMNYQPDLKNGFRSVFAILFPMEALFESYVVSILKRSARKTSFKVASQRSKHFWRGEDKGLKTVRPDIIIDYPAASGRARIILDTKWKVPKNQLPSDNDLKQMFVYNNLFQAESSNLVYPSGTASMNRDGFFMGENNGKCSLWYVPILDDDAKGLNQSLGENILSSIL